MTALRELKRRLPPERRGKGRSGTLATLQYALACVKQVQGEWCFRGGQSGSWVTVAGQAPLNGPFSPLVANQEYYQQWSLEEGEPCSMDMSTYTLEELEHITSEYTLRNQVSVPQPCLLNSLALSPRLLTLLWLSLSHAGHLLCGGLLPDRPNCLHF